MSACPSRAPAISSCSIRNGCPAPTRRRRPNQQGCRFPRNGERPRAQMGPRQSRRLRIPHRRARRRHDASISTSSMCRRQPSNQGRIVATPDMASIEWIANSHVSRGLFRSRHSDPGFGDRAHRLEGRDGAAPQRPDRQPHRLSGHELRDPDGLAADRRGALPQHSAERRRHARRDRRQ